MSAFWSVVWRWYDTRLVYGLLRPLGGARLAPWLFGKMIGSKGTRIDDGSCEDCSAKVDPTGYAACSQCGAECGHGSCKPCRSPA